MIKLSHTIVLLILGISIYTTSHAQSVFDYVDDAFIMTNIKSVYSGGDVGCEILVYVDTKDIESNGDIKIQIGSFLDPSAFLNSTIDFSNIEDMEGLISYKEKNGIYELNFGNMRLSGEYAARIFIKDGHQILTYDLPPVGYDHWVTNM